MNMAKIKVTCDSICDLPAEVCKKYDIRVIPLGINFGENHYFDGVDITTPELFEYVKQYGDLPKTNAVSLGDYMDIFGAYVEQGYSVIHITISSEMSVCYHNACLAAQELGNVYPIDSRNLSSGSGHLVLKAAELAAAGMEAKDIADALNEMKTRLDVSFVVQTLDYLKKGGRCSAVVAFGANVLKIRPEICVKNGVMGLGKKYRGNVRKSVTDYIKEKLEGRDDLELDRIFITHSPMDQAIVDEVEALVRQLQPFKEIIVSDAGCTISSHCGPECLGVLFFTKKAQ
ncbi:MAG: DegV family protein [Oscillospiraceae bacterium]|nr:DegV family protein [Oscillospiraceae bacterium]